MKNQIDFYPEIYTCFQKKYDEEPDCFQKFIPVSDKNINYKETRLIPVSADKNINYEIKISIMKNQIDFQKCITCFRQI